MHLSSRAGLGLPKSQLPLPAARAPSAGPRCGQRCQQESSSPSTYHLPLPTVQKGRGSRGRGLPKGTQGYGCSREQPGHGPEPDSAWAQWGETRSAGSWRGQPEGCPLSASIQGRCYARHGLLPQPCAPSPPLTASAAAGCVRGWPRQAQPGPPAGTELAGQEHLISAPESDTPSIRALPAPAAGAFQGEMGFSSALNSHLSPCTDSVAGNGLCQGPCCRVSPGPCDATVKGAGGHPGLLSPKCPRARSQLSTRALAEQQAEAGSGEVGLREGAGNKCPMQGTHAQVLPQAGRGATETYPRQEHLVQVRQRVRMAEEERRWEKREMEDERGGCSPRHQAGRGGGALTGAAPAGSSGRPRRCAGRWWV